MRVIPVSPIPSAHNSHVPHLSPLRYPGGKTWLLPHVKEWLANRRQPPLLLEPFCGGATVSLFAAAERLAQRCVMVEIDPDIATFWQACFRRADDLCSAIATFELTDQNVVWYETQKPVGLINEAFTTLLRNRTRFGGILNRPALLNPRATDARPRNARWYPATITRRIRIVSMLARRQRLEFIEGDGIQAIDALKYAPPGTVIFADPPYLHAGARMYRYHELDHEKLFEVLAAKGLDFLMTYDAAPAIVDLVSQHGWAAARVRMKNNHNQMRTEIIITPRPHPSLGTVRVRQESAVAGSPA